MSVQAVVFDLDDTLSNFTEAENYARIKISHRLAEETNLAAEEFDRTFLNCAAFLLTKEREGLWVEYTQKRFNTLIWQQVFDTLQIKPDAAYWAMEHMNTRDRYLSLYPDVLPVLNRMSDIPKGLISNGPVDNQRHETVILKIEQYFQSQQYEGELGFGKPDERIFRLVENELGFTGQALVMVGDSPYMDITGAREVGWRTVWLNRNGKTYPENITQPDAIISSLTDLFQVFPKWGLNIS
jgi:HAD superfamily hydrolase (TIGR01549 family)